MAPQITLSRRGPCCTPCLCRPWAALLCASSAGAPCPAPCAGAPPPPRLVWPCASPDALVPRLLTRPRAAPEGDPRHQAGRATGGSAAPRLPLPLKPANLFLPAAPAHDAPPQHPRPWGSALTCQANATSNVTSAAQDTLPQLSGSTPPANDALRPRPPPPKGCVLRAARDERLLRPGG